MTRLKNNKISQNSVVFRRKILEKDFQLFPNMFNQIFSDFDQKQLILHSVRANYKLEKKKKRLPKLKIWVSHTRKTRSSFFVA